MAGYYLTGAAGSTDRLFLVQLAFTVARNALMARGTQEGGRGEGGRE